jgi:mono/diheme cytochrome c family protein
MLQPPILIFATACMLSAIMAASALSQTDASVARGRDLSDRACAGCHATTGTESRTIQGKLVPSFSAIAGGPHGSAERLKAIIATPSHPMPAIPLSLAEINDLAAYIRSLQ